MTEQEQKEFCFEFLQWMVDNWVKCQRDLVGKTSFMIKMPVNWEVVDKEQLYEMFKNRANV